MSFQGNWVEKQNVGVGSPKMILTWTLNGSNTKHKMIPNGPPIPIPGVIKSLLLGGKNISTKQLFDDCLLFLWKRKGQNKNLPGGFKRGQ